jgi:hypothetical protein
MFTATATQVLNIVNRFWLCHCCNNARELDLLFLRRLQVTIVWAATPTRIENPLVLHQPHVSLGTLSSAG